MSAPTTAALACMPEVTEGVFPADVIARLERSVTLVDRVPLDDFDGPRAKQALSETEILVTAWGCPPIGAAVLDAAPRLRAVVHAAGSIKRHVGDEVFTRGIAVSSAAEANARPVAEYTVAMCVLAAKRAFSLARSYALGERTHDYSAEKAPSLDGATTGVIGASRTGRQVIGMLAAHRTRILVHDPFLSADGARELGVESVGLDELCLRSDVITVHAPETPETRHMIDDRRMSLMADGAVLINTARGSLVDTEALIRHCGAGRIDAVLDVTDPEPLPSGHPLLTLPNVMVTPHLAGAHGREVRRLGEYAVAEVERLLGGLPLRGLVTADQLTRIA
ncbi:hydroxyacid dehydrogenase [Streptomyces sp. NPDC007861]|uniref:hydroxyacid dehydrogenase n=1 Tax=Streptomyces sp. NPDC007861 TaxID=3154893 RepID=UPI0034008C97